MENIGKTIRHYRKAANLTQSQLASASNISLMSIRRYETNQRTPDTVSYTHLDVYKRQVRYSAI